MNQARRTIQYGNRAGYSIFRWVIKRFGVFPAYGVLVPVIAYYVLCRPSAYRAAAPYLEHRFAPTCWLKKIWLTYRYYFSFGLCLIDQAAMSILGRKGLKIVFPDADQLRELSEEGRGLVLIVSHIGVWHSAISTLDYLKRSVYLNWRREKHSQSMGLGDCQDGAVDVHIISPDAFLGGIPEMSLALANGQIVAIMGDRTYGSTTGQRVDFLGRKALFPILPYHLAFSTQSDLVIFLTSRIGPRRILIRAAVKRMTEELQKLGKAQASSVLLNWYATELEKHLNAFPYMWYNFIDIWNL